MPEIHHRYATVDGRRLFYREAGDPAKPTFVLLHGFPTSSHMFRTLIPALAGDFHVIAPDHLGFGLSDAPPAGEFDYSFDALTDLTEALLDRLGVDRYAIYVQDYGAPIGWRLALRRPAAITAIVSQSGNAYESGLVPAFWAPVRDYWAAQTPETEAGVRGALTLDAIRWQYLHGVPDETLVDPTTWWHDVTLIGRPGNDEIQLRLFLDYATNLALYPRVHDYFRTTGVPLLAVWGRHDEIFGPAGAQAFTADLPNAEIHLLEGGHFLLESALDETATLIHRFLTTHLPH
ncbi:MULTISPECIES: alpha/beta fold hydrolase [Catenuloplanes]|uniref:Pimeloyl-ACP methyl ester carboxylesterase n=1 Tax=Catenuloplanes niger TaxID=587534 RepID=A0AAE4CVD3_9ACTN|nr:alpha/beta hydrolase [Catenuloplanes niger]MDR7327221.1 pimeloyl-ACP methyl ester carboxylesterase [Catenuloplanes niger]